MKLVLIPAGKFMMGSPAKEKDRQDNEGPQREVTISKPFYMGACEVTQSQWAAVMGTTIAQQRDKAKKGKDWGLFGEGDDHPMYYVSWDEAIEFCKRLSQETGETVALPTEAQWEYACRAGSKTRFSHGDDDARLVDYVWWTRNSDSKTHPVGQRKPNQWGLHDMHGNVSEWCSDWYAESYANANKTDPTGPASGSHRVLRGSPWGGFPGYLRSAHRGYDLPVFCIGFRVSAVLKFCDDQRQPLVYPAGHNCLDQALEIDPRDAQSWTDKGKGLGRLGRYEEAIACYDKALEIEPRFAEAWHKEGEALILLGCYHKAIACFKKALRIDPRSVRAWTNKGISLDFLGHYHKAIACFDTALEIDPREPTALKFREEYAARQRRRSFWKLFKVPWKEQPTREKLISIIATIVVVPFFPVLVLVLLPHLIYKHGWNPRNWNLF